MKLPPRPVAPTPREPDYVALSAAYGKKLLAWRRVCRAMEARYAHFLLLARRAFLHHALTHPDSEVTPDDVHLYVDFPCDVCTNFLSRVGVHFIDIVRIVRRQPSKRIPSLGREIRVYRLTDRDRASEWLATNVVPSGAAPEVPKE